MESLYSTLRSLEASSSSMDSNRNGLPQSDKEARQREWARKHINAVSSSFQPPLNSWTSNTAALPLFNHRNEGEINETRSQGSKIRPPELSAHHRDSMSTSFFPSETRRSFTNTTIPPPPPPPPPPRLPHLSLAKPQFSDKLSSLQEMVHGLSRNRHDDDKVVYLGNSNSTTNKQNVSGTNNKISKKVRQKGRKIKCQQKPVIDRKKLATTGLLASDRRTLPEGALKAGSVHSNVNISRKRTSPVVTKYRALDPPSILYGTAIGVPCPEPAIYNRPTPGTALLSGESNTKDSHSIGVRSDRTISYSPNSFGGSHPSPVVYTQSFDGNRVQKDKETSKGTPNQTMPSSSYMNSTCLFHTEFEKSDQSVMFPNKGKTDFVDANNHSASSEEHDFFEYVPIENFNLLQSLSVVDEIKSPLRKQSNSQIPFDKIASPIRSTDFDGQSLNVYNETIDGEKMNPNSMLSSSISLDKQNDTDTSKHPSSVEDMSDDKVPPKSLQLTKTKIQLLKAKSRLLLAQKKKVEMMSFSSERQDSFTGDGCSDTQQTLTGYMNDDRSSQNGRHVHDSSLPDISAFSMPSLIIENIGSSGPPEMIRFNNPHGLKLKFQRDKAANGRYESIQENHIFDIVHQESEDVDNDESPDGKNVLPSGIPSSDSITPQMINAKKRSLDLQLELARRRLKLKLLEQAKKVVSLEFDGGSNGIPSESDQQTEPELELCKPNMVEDVSQGSSTSSETTLANNDTAEFLRLRQSQLRQIIEKSRQNQKELYRHQEIGNLTSMVDKQRELLLDYGERVKETTATLKECLKGLELEKASIKTCEACIDDLSNRKQILENMVLDITQKLIASRRLKEELQLQKFS